MRLSMEASKACAPAAHRPFAAPAEQAVEALVARAVEPGQLHRLDRPGIGRAGVHQRPSRGVAQHVEYVARIASRVPAAVP